MRWATTALVIALCGSPLARAQEPGGRTATIMLVTTTVAVEAVDRQAGVLTVRGADGMKMTLRVADPKIVESLSPGDRIQVTYAPASHDGEAPVVTATKPADGQATNNPAQSQAPATKAGNEADFPTWSTVDASGSGIVLGRGRWGSVSLGGYALVRYINQSPGTQTFVDHLGNQNVVNGRNDIQFHRAMLTVRGWLGSPKIRYQITAWSVMSTDQTTLYGFLGYQVEKKFNIYAGISGLPGSRSLMGSHPFWLANDRVMADEFFRPGFAGSMWVNGELAPGFWYNATVANNLSQLGLTANKLTRDLGTGVTFWWMPTTKEFGPNGSYDDWEYHEKLATRFGVSTSRSREDRFNQNINPSPDNTQIRLADSLLLFQTGALAQDVTVQKANFRILSVDGGMKYKGVFLQTEVYNRWLDNFLADGPLPVASIHDVGFYVQGAFYPIKKKLELYGATSWVYGDKSAGFTTSHEWIQGGNFFPADSRNYRLNAQVIEVARSPVSSLFGFYVGGQTGTTVSAAFSVFF